MYRVGTFQVGLYFVLTRGKTCRFISNLRPKDRTTLSIFSIHIVARYVVHIVSQIYIFKYEYCRYIPHWCNIACIENLISSIKSVTSSVEIKVSIVGRFCVNSASLTFESFMTEICSQIF